MDQYIVETPFKGSINTVITNGKILYSEAKSFEEYQSLNPDKTFELWDDERLTNEVNKFNISLCDDWQEITEDQYDEMLCVLPPLKWRRDTFFICEATTSNIHGFYCKHGDKYYTSLQPVNKDLDLIMESLKNHLKGE